MDEDNLNDPVFVDSDDNCNDPVYFEDSLQSEGVHDPVDVVPAAFTDPVGNLNMVLTGLHIDENHTLTDSSKDPVLIEPAENLSDPVYLESQTALPPPPIPTVRSVTIAAETTSGTKTYPNGDTYVGGLLGEKRSGQGILKYADGKVKYQGAWANDLYHGQGVFYNEKGSKYEGVWQAGLKDGLFMCSLFDGTAFTGMHVEDKRHGQGVHKYANGKVKYDGEWVNNQPNGQGTRYYEDGAKYVGAWKDGLCHGHGVRTCANGAVYTGMWQADQRHGQGVFTYPSGKIQYTGGWANDKLNGYGKFYHESGARYEGEYKDTLMHGTGVYTTARGEVLSGAFNSDRYVGKIEYFSL